MNSTTDNNVEKKNMFRKMLTKLNKNGIDDEIKNKDKDLLQYKNDLELISNLSKGLEKVFIKEKINYKSYDNEDNNIDDYNNYDVKKIITILKKREEYITELFKDYSITLEKLKEQKEMIEFLKTQLNEE